RESIVDEWGLLVQNKTWDSVDKPEGANVIGCKWVLAKKFNF
ncbi:unnamed protein product, partial [Heterosigma akashiwo]